MPQRIKNWVVKHLIRDVVVTLEFEGGGRTKGAHYLHYKPFKDRIVIDWENKDTWQR